jgi:hypothetical protein
MACELDLMGAATVGGGWLGLSLRSPSIIGHAAGLALHRINDCQAWPVSYD